MFILTLQTQQKQRQTQPKPNRDGQNLCVSSAMPPHDDFDRSTDHSAIIKGKRTKRPRSNSPSKPPPAAAATSSSSSATATAPPQAHDDYCNSSIVSPATSSGEIYESTEEEEDMANCLIMLAQGNRFDSERKQNDAAERKFSDGSRKLSEIATTTNKAGFFVYECKTCNRAFPSFQALGGHRASHKKPKMITGEEKSKPVKEIHDHPEETEISTAPTLALQMGSANNRAKVHECSICGAEFSSGQALGGHMRRHRAVIGSQAAVSVETTADSSNGTDEIKQRNVLSLDLNLPAPEDDHHLHGSPKFQFVAFPTPALVDCHY